MTLAEAEATYPDEFSGNSISQPTYKDAANVDFTPASSSSAQVDAGAWLTTITSATGSGTTFNVDNPYFFYDGWNITGETGDTIETQGGQKAVITRIAYSTGKITVDKTISWTQGEGLSLPYSGSAPDIGAIEYSGAQGCSEDWQCTVWSLWSACADNEQSRTRTCTDANSCGTTTGKPAESETQSCSASTNTYTILKTSTPPTIDGKINEFANANQITSTNSRGTTGTYKMLWDSNGLYIAAQVSDHQLAALNSTRDGALWGDDSIELFFDPLNNGGTYLSSDDYKFFVNLLNTQRDNYIGGGGISWNAAFSSAVKTTGTLNTPGNADTGYTIEIAIPWTNWGVAVPADNSVWGFDVSMDDRDDSGDVIQKSWSQTNVGNIPDEFGDVTFSSQIVTPSQSVCNTPADSDSNGMISITELISYISMWKSGNVSIGDLIAAIGKWKNGC